MKHLTIYSLAVLTIAAAAPMNAAAQAGVKSHRDLAYIEGGHARQKLDLHVPEKAEGPLPVIVWIHGGGWQSGSKDLCLPLRQGYVEKGYAVASVGYRLSGDAVFPAQIEDCKAAVRWLRAHAKEYGLDPKRFAAWGSSAGGHLVALLGTSGEVKPFDVGPHLDQSSGVQAVCDFYGPTDFTVFVKTPGYERHAQAEAPEGKLIGGAVLENPAKAERVNPISYVSQGDPPFLIVHGDEDRTVPLNQSQLLFEALKKHGIGVHFHTLKGAGHGGPGFSDEKVDGMVSAFFERTLRGKGGEAEALQTESTASAEGAPRSPGMTGPRGGIPWEAIARREDKNNDGKISREEFRGPGPLFERLDRNRDGMLMKEDFGGAAPAQPAPPSAPAPTPSAARFDPKAAPNIKNFKIEGERWTCEADGRPITGILVRPAGKGPFPAILINHGMGSNAEQFGMMKAREFVKWGFVCIATDLAHGRAGQNADRSLFGASPENLRRAQACLAVLRGLPEVDAKRICVYGNSMGAFLTIALAAELPDEIAAAAITAGGVITQSGFAAPTADTAAKIRAPFLILHGNPDTTVPTENSARLQEVLNKNRVANHRRVFDGVGHNLHMEKQEEVFRLMRDWFTKHEILTR
ncbi:MAG TPA: prolyl oligopeptidase family serine peptidase [Prosthecobacter sp.]|nr:prolyl oligopeptidase family serine peptidase [Prosthecobacter sp.]